MAYFALEHPNPNAVAQGYAGFWGYTSMNHTPRAVVIHTTESLADQDGPDNGAENVANWFQTNNVYALYHTLVDADSTVRVVPAGLDGTQPHTAFHAAGYNSYTLGCSMALQAAAWPTLPVAYKDRVLNRAAAEVALWCVRWSIPVAARTKAEIDGGATGITGHGILDPGYRSDPGAGFPWADFLARVQAFVGGGDTSTAEGAEMPDYLVQLRDNTVCAVYPNGNARPLGGGEYRYLTTKGLVMIATSDIGEDDRIKQYAFNK